MADHPSLALTTPGPAAPQFRLARSLAAAEVGEVMALDDRGDIVSPGRSRGAEVQMWLGAGALGGLAWVSSASLGFSAALGPVFLASCLALVAWESRKLGRLKRAIALAAAGRREEAQAAFEDLERRKNSPGMRATVNYWQGSICWQLGDHSAAEARFEAAIAHLRSHQKHGVLFHIIQFSRSQLLAVLGRIELAEALRNELDSAPTGSYFRLARRLTDLSIAFHRKSADGIPEDLYDWARDALELSRFGQMVVLLAWAFEERGDHEMAVLLVSEAPARLQGCFLEQCDPDLYQWFENRRASWDLPATYE